MASTKLERLEFAIGLRDNASSKVSKLRKSLSGMTETVHEQSLRAGTGVMAAGGSAMAIHQMVAPAIDLNRALGEVASLDVDNASLKILSASAKKFAIQYGGSAAEVVRASYDIQSGIAGLTGKELASFSVASGVLAKATKADVGTVTSYMGTMYGIFKNQADKMGKAQWVEQLAGRTALAVQMFKTTGDEMSSAFTALGANATAAGVAAEEQMAILGTLQATMGGSEAGTKYKAFLSGVGSAQEKLGLSFTDSQGNMLGMVDILGKIQGKFGDTLSVAESDALKDAFGSDEAVSLIKQLMADTTGLGKSIDTIGKVNGMDKARQMAAKMTDIWGRMGGAVNVVGASFGQALLPPLELIVGKFVAVLDTVNRWITIAPNLARWVGYGAMVVMGLAGAMGLLAAATAVSKMAMLGIAGPFKLVAATIGFLSKMTGLQTAAQWLLNAALWANPMTWVVIGIVALIAAVAAVIYWWDDLKAAFLDTAWGQALMATIEAVMVPFKALGKVWDWLGEKLGFGGKAEITATAANSAATAGTTMPAPTASLPSLDAPRASTVPSGGILKANSSYFNKSNSKQTSIGQVTINTERPLSPGELEEYMALQAG
ncbi:phage tail tape measure protein [Desulfocurvibacter africanus]|uniref:phage tail tape measure protein n=1 Tax=Desulfocurvibacter africanus TaxID=873 RepID=UPI0004134559|nr:phage tail tape measure protein [Desulfocurvibacter africanus]